MRRVVLLLLLPPVLAATTVGWHPSAARADAGWTWPVQPHQVVRGFDPPPPEEPWLGGHRGVDLRSGAGTPVHAAGAGVVRFAGRVADIPVVSVAHPGGLVTTYEPVRPAVRVGEQVTAGATLGHLVVAGGHCPPRTCLHWGLRRGADYLDPLGLVGAGEVRLLPVPLAAGPPDAPLPAGAAVVVVAMAGWCRRRRHSAFGHSTSR